MYLTNIKIKMLANLFAYLIFHLKHNATISKKKDEWSSYGN